MDDVILRRNGLHMKRNPSRVFIIGYGEMGHAMERLLGETHHLVIHDSRPLEGLVPINFEQEVGLADFVLLCVPALPIRELLEKMSPYLQDHCICLSISKGLDEQGKTPAQVYGEIFNGQRPYGVLYGPMIAEEICLGRHAFAELWCTDTAACQRVHDLYVGTTLHLTRGSDIVGVSWSVILKNVYALAFGISDELQLGDNVRGFLMVTALAELSSIVRQMGGKTETAWRLAGLGDLVTTSTSSSSHHHALGRELARGTARNISGEGIHTLSMVEKYHLFDSEAYPLYSFIKNAVDEPVGVADRLQALLYQLN
jgi:glycerol-3-phosphate dehydrogenase (NAD(P)+)